MIPDYLDQIQRQIFFNLGEDLIINHLYDDQICYSVTPEIYNYLIYKYICLGHNYLYAILDFRPKIVLLVPDTEDPRVELGFIDFIPLHLSLETPTQPTIRFHLLISKSE